jgi:hypothetical protein|tara:strand:- start:3543 stop:4517 length:975 start_codon:yes stop_codon:yes gene_type:complete
MAEDEVTIVSTDEAILNNIGEGDEQTTTEGASEQAGGTEQDTTTETSKPSSEQSSTEQPGTEQQQQTRGPQDIVDAEGRVIASGGKERRFYETAQREKQRADNATREVETLKSHLEAINEAGNLGTQYNLSPEEVTTGAQVIAAYKEDPVGTLKYMLTQAQANGYNMDEIVAGGTDMGAIKQLLDNALAPFTAAHQEQAVTQEADNRANELYDNFVAQHPDAVIHNASLARLLKDDPSLSLEAAYYKLQNYYLSKGFAWTKPLEVLAEEARAAQTTNVETSPQPPNGGGVAQSQVTDTAQVADVGTSSDDIIKQAMNDAGIPIN